MRDRDVQPSRLAPGRRFTAPPTFVSRRVAVSRSMNRNTKWRRIRKLSATCDSATLIYDPLHIEKNIHGCVCACLHVHVRLCVRTCVRARVCVRGWKQSRRVAESQTLAPTLPAPSACDDGVVASGHPIWVDGLTNTCKSWCQQDRRPAITIQLTFGRDLAAPCPGVLPRHGAGGVPFYERIHLQEQRP